MMEQDRSSPMRPPLDSYGPPPESDPSFGPPGAPRHRWLQWLPLAISSALLVLFFNQLVELQNLNRRVARLYERMDLLDRNRMLDTAPALAAQQTLILKRLQELETMIGNPGEQQQDAPRDRGPAALQAPPPPGSTP